MSDSERTRPIFPIVDRPAPLLERLRDNDKEQPANRFGKKLGKEMVMLSQLEGEEREDVRESIIDGIAEGISSSSGVEQQYVNVSELEEIVDELFNDEGRLVDLPDSMTIDEIDDEEDEEESSFSDSDEE